MENRKEQALLRDTRAEEIVASIDYDFARFDELPSLTGALLRTRLFDRWVTEFLSAHPGGTVVEIGTGLNTRYERVDNGRARWFDLDLPDVIELREKFFTDSRRRTMIAASVTDDGWAADVASHSSGPYLFVAEAVLPHLHEPDGGLPAQPPTASLTPRPSRADSGAASSHWRRGLRAATLAKPP
ncbi:class I SAM-dependent methyltransferase [Streptomyces pakalii]|uniref:Class I SAM-dependent methyltransferase n=1 Tax=Streptomyces pakalii TaxID=3036494 RepID=A0ABT7DAP3_9ACTN|nr:class I SAM-dependent methyltransferase [Streptomyces pakalii]MDJ1642883.1 class I SAM-dependent methyltransferase [Streptomyces pakalii]